MNPPELIKLAQNIDLDNEGNFMLRVTFGIACITRVEHLLTNTLVLDALSIGKAFVVGKCSIAELNQAAITAARLARSHPGSESIDGANSAAVSTSHGLAAALAGKALQAAAYAAYASVYSYASYAVTDLSAYSSEHEWQINKLNSLTKDIQE